MAVVKCEMGHYYDNGKFTACPHCESAVSGLDDGKTVSGDMLERRVRTVGQQVIDFGKVSPGDEKTVGIYKKKHGSNPVTGWLVCIKGPEKGRDYRLHSGRNFMGRALKMDISIPEDGEISREGHCSVVFDPKSETFMLVPGSANTYLNGESVSESAQLADSDVIGAGASEFVFIPYCTKGRSW